MSEIITFNPEQKPTKAKLEKAFPSDSYMLGILAVHGFEPSIIAAGVGIKINEDLEANGLGRRPIIIPRIYGERLDDVLRDEFPLHQDQIYMSNDLASILNLTQFTTAGYQDHLEKVARFQPEVRNMLTNFLAKPFKVTTLDGKSEVIIYPEQKPVELNIGANVTATKEAHSIFPIRFSDLLKYIRNNPRLYDSYNPDTLRKVERIAREMEEDHKTTQIPDFHSLSAQDWFDPKGIIFVPHLKDPKIAPQDLDTSNENGGIYINVSDGGMGKEAAALQSRDLSQKAFAVLAPSWLNFDFATSAGPNALYSKSKDGTPFIKAFVMRPGFGSIWNAIEAEIPVGYIASDIYDSPEMPANENALDSASFGHIFTAREDMIDVFEGMSEKIKKYKEDMYQRLGLPMGTSGLSITARNIVKSEAGTR